MGFLDTLGTVAKAVGNAAVDSYNTFSDDYHTSKDKYSDRYSRMSNAQLKAEAQKSHYETSAGKRTGRNMALKQELTARGMINKK